jgi:hypothetical protein
MKIFLDLTKKILGLKLKKTGPKFFFLGLIKSGALGECLTRLGFEPALRLPSLYLFFNSHVNLHLLFVFNPSQRNLIIKHTQIFLLKKPKF